MKNTESVKTSEIVNTEQNSPEIWGTSPYRLEYYSRTSTACKVLDVQQRLLYIRHTARSSAKYYRNTKFK